MAESRQNVVVRGAREAQPEGGRPRLSAGRADDLHRVSGSGKSSLAYHTIYQEGQRRFLESLSSYARQFLGRMEKPKPWTTSRGCRRLFRSTRNQGSHSPRSTVGTLTEILDFTASAVRSAGHAQLPGVRRGHRIVVGRPDRRGDPGRSVRRSDPILRARARRCASGRVSIARSWRSSARGASCGRGSTARCGASTRTSSLHRYKYHTIELVVDRLRDGGGQDARGWPRPSSRRWGSPHGLLAVLRDEDYQVFSTQRACPDGHGALPEMEPRLFSFNSPIGACSHCDGLGQIHSFAEDLLVRDPSLSPRDGALACITAEGKLAYSPLHPRAPRPGRGRVRLRHGHVPARALTSGAICRAIAWVKVM